ncbi:MAG: transporter substrate-binding domain-containing protein [Mailhella sp.]|nr:transporter substrate-binding domain-containing protein [Mailhella sp.]
MHLAKKLFAAAAAICAILTAVPAPAAGTDLSAIQKIAERGTIRVGFSSFVPWAMQDKDGKYIGFEIDVMTRLAKDLDVDLQLVPTNWDGIIPALLTDKFDVIVGGMGATPSRALSVNFTVPYDYSYMDAVLNTERCTDVKTEKDLNKPEVIIAVRTGTSAATHAKNFYPKATLRMFNDEAPAVEEVLSGRAHAFVSSAPLPAMEALRHPDKLSQPFRIKSSRTPISFAIRKGDPDTLNVLDTWIRYVEEEGWLEERRNYWFRGNEWESLLK